MQPFNRNLGMQPQAYFRFAELLCPQCLMRGKGRHCRGFNVRSFICDLSSSMILLGGLKKCERNGHMHPSCSHFGTSRNAFGTEMGPEAGRQSESSTWETRQAFSITEPCMQHRVTWWFCEKQKHLLTLKEWQLLIVNCWLLNR